MADSNALKIPVVRDLLAMAVENLNAAVSGPDDSLVRHAVATSVFSAAAVEAGLSAFVYAAAR